MVGYILRGQLMFTLFIFSGRFEISPPTCRNLRPRRPEMVPLNSSFFVLFQGSQRDYSLVSSL